MTNGIVIGIEGTPMLVRILPHRTDDNKVVIKSQHPEAGVALCSIAEISHGPIEQGSRFFRTVVDRAEFLAKVGPLLATITKDMLDAYVRKPELKLLPPVKCPECGTDDGTHYNYCGDKVLN